MRQSRLYKIIITTASILAILGLLGGCGNDEPAQAAPDNSNIRYQPYQSATNENASSLENPAENNQVPLNVTHTHNVTVINTTFESVAVNPTALSAEDAAQVGAQYIQDIFGYSINGMYVELEFTNWEHMTRTLWNGAVTVSRRDTLEQRARMNELNDEIMARYEAGEDMDDIHEDMADSFREFTYTLARFYFTIDGITGKRIDIRQMTPSMLNQPTPDHDAMEAYIEREWDGDWGAAFEAEISPQEESEFSQLAMEYAQRQFNTTTVASVEFNGAFASLIYTGGGNFTREYFINFLATDETDREAHISFEKASGAIISIHSMGNDFVPIEWEGEREYIREEVEYNDTNERSRP